MSRTYRTSARGIIVIIFLVLFFLAGIRGGISHLISTYSLARMGSVIPRNLRTALMVQSLRIEVEKEPEGTVFLVMLTQHDYWDLRYEFYHTPNVDGMPDDILPSDSQDKIYHSFHGREMLISWYFPGTFVSEEKVKKLMDKWNAGPTRRPIQYMLVYGTEIKKLIVVRKFDTDGKLLYEEG